MSRLRGTGKLFTGDCGTGTTGLLWAPLLEY